MENLAAALPEFPRFFRDNLFGLLAFAMLVLGAIAWSFFAPAVNSGRQVRVATRVGIFVYLSVFLAMVVGVAVWSTKAVSRGAAGSEPAFRAMATRADQTPQPAPSRLLNRRKVGGGQERVGVTQVMLMIHPLEIQKATPIATFGVVDSQPESLTERCGAVSSSSDDDYLRLVLNCRVNNPEFGLSRLRELFGTYCGATTPGGSGREALIEEARRCIFQRQGQTLRLLEEFSR